MKKYFKSSLILLLAALMLASCGNSGTSETEKSDSSVKDSSATETQPEETEDPYADSLPEDISFNGETINILVGDVHGGITFPTYYVEDTTGDVVNDAVYDRNLAVSERLNTNLQFNCINFDWGIRDTYIGGVKNTIVADDGSIDLLYGPGFYTTSMIPDGYFLDMNTVDNIDFTKPYWTKLYNDPATINGKTYSALGDFSINKLQLSYVMYFNKQMFDNAGIKYPYESVMNGTWTLDALEGLVSNTYIDVNGDGTCDDGDIYGFRSESNNMLWAFMDPCNIKVFDKDSNGEMQFVMDNEHNANAIDRLSRFLEKSPDVSHIGINDYSMKSFYNGLSYITPQTLSMTDTMRDLEFDYGIIPYPKYDESYKNYSTRTSSAISIAFIPSCCKKTAYVGALLEAMNSETVKSVIPAYYETALKIKYARDNESVKVLDIVKDSISIQFVDIYSEIFSGYSSIVRDVLGSDASTWSSNVASIKEAANEKLKTLMEYYNK